MIKKYMNKNENHVCPFWNEMVYNYEWETYRACVYWEVVTSVETFAEQNHYRQVVQVIEFSKFKTKISDNP